jgi:4-diphosphocytidyl-2-C-methyl-D-erythritol kinase
MYFRRDPSKWSARAPAKLNLYLEVLDRRPDGFHELETLMVPIRLSDSLTLEATPAPADGSPGEIQFSLDLSPLRQDAAQAAIIPAGPSNLVVRALALLRERSGAMHGARVTLTKRVPAAAGLGGGSSDAAAALRLASRAWQLNWPKQRVAELSAELGSDVPFFFAQGPAVCRGRGELVEHVGPLSRLHFVIVKPPVELATASVYRALDQSKHGSRTTPSLDQFLNRISTGHPFSSGGWLHNRLQSAAASLTPWIGRLQEVFRQLDCIGHQLSGSGSAYFGVCRHAQQARRLATMLKTRQLGIVYATCSYP